MTVSIAPVVKTWRRCGELRLRATLELCGDDLTLLAVKNLPEPPLQPSVLCTAKERVKDQSTRGAASIGGGY